MAERGPVVALLGGSSAWTPRLAAALADRADDLPALTVRLTGRAAARAEAVARFCQALAQRRGVGHRWQAAPSVAAAAAGAQVVVNQVRVGGFAARAHDEGLPLRFDLPGDETVGPGALAAALRATAPTLAAAAAAARVAPDAHFVNLANPMGILLQALRSGGHRRCFGLCELPGTTLTAALARLGVAPAAVEACDYVGLNHQGFWTRVMVGGDDVVPRLLDALAAGERAGAPLAPFQVTAAAMRPFAALLLPYWRLYLHRAAAVAAARARSRGGELEALASDLHAHYAAHRDGVLPAAMVQRATPWLDLAVAPALLALLGGPPARLFVSEPNAGYLPFLPPDAIVEKQATVGARGAQPLPLAPASLAHAERNRWLTAIAGFEARAAQAARAPSRATIAAALRAQPMRLEPAAIDGLTDALAAVTCGGADPRPAAPADGAAREGVA